MNLCGPEFSVMITCRLVSVLCGPLSNFLSVIDHLLMHKPQKNLYYLFINKKLFRSGTLADVASGLHVLPNTKNRCQIQKVLACAHVCVCVCVCALTHPVRPPSYIHSPELSGRLSGSARHQVGKSILLWGWKQISNQANQCQNHDRLMGAVTDLMSSWPLCHAIVIYIVRPYHLIAISHYYYFVGAICKDWLLIYVEQPTSAGIENRWSQLVFLGRIKCVSGGNKAEAWIIFSLKGYSLWCGVWLVALPLLLTSAGPGHSTYRYFQNQLLSLDTHTHTRMHTHTHVRTHTHTNTHTHSAGMLSVEPKWAACVR